MQTVQGDYVPSPGVSEWTDRCESIVKRRSIDDDEKARLLRKENAAFLAARFEEYPVALRPRVYATVSNLSSR